MPKKGGKTLVHNEKNELVPMRPVIGWRLCVDYRKLNAWTEKEHFPMPFMGQMLERLAGKEWYYFLNGYSGYNQIFIARSIKWKPPLVVLMELPRSRGCLLGCIIHQLLLGDV